MKTHWQDQLKISVLILFIILYGIRNKTLDVILVQCPLKKQNKTKQGLLKTGLAWQGLQSMEFSKLLAEGEYDILILKVEQGLLKKNGLKCAAGPTGSTGHGMFKVISWRG